jgi:hypothetical protein
LSGRAFRKNHLVSASAISPTSSHCSVGEP